MRFFRAHRDAETAPLPVEGPLPGFDGATGWLNSEPVTRQGLRGRVVLVDFWTYTCINWLRTLPFVRAWDEKYRGNGLTVIGVHTPEFEFEQAVDNVIAAAREMNVGYPIALDNDYAIWRAFANHFWPALYIADAEGRIRYHHFGEGEYEMTEMVVQQLLIEAGAETVDRDLVSVDAREVELPADWRSLRSSETYLGSDRIDGLASPDGAWFGEPHVYAPPVRLGLNQWTPSGTWTIGPHAAASDVPNGRIVYRFHARDLHLVMGPSSRDVSIPFRVLVDGQPPGAAHGGDIDAEGNGNLIEQRLYHLIRQPSPISERVFEIEFLDAGAEAYCFTFG
jgi:thiol-disulfide isomerase/thioredoxin